TVLARSADRGHEPCLRLPAGVISTVTCQGRKRLMTHSRSTLSLITVLLVIGALGAGFAWRLLGQGERAEAAAASALDSLPDDLQGVMAQGAGQFSTDVPTPVRGAEVVRDTLWIRVSAAGRAEAVRRTTPVAQVAGTVREVLVRENERIAPGA